MGAIPRQNVSILKPPATRAVSSALAGRALEAADYASYAALYAYGSYAVAEPAAFEGEFEWQLKQLMHLGSC